MPLRQLTPPALIILLAQRKPPIQPVQHTLSLLGPQGMRHLPRKQLMLQVQHTLSLLGLRHQPHRQRIPQVQTIQRQQRKLLTQPAQLMLFLQAVRVMQLVQRKQLMRRLQITPPLPLKLHMQQVQIMPHQPLWQHRLEN